VPASPKRVSKIGRTEGSLYEFSNVTVLLSKLKDVT
jgi:hypothetical protein